MKSQLGGLRRKFMENHLQMGSFETNGYSNKKYSIHNVFKFNGTFLLMQILRMQ